MAESPFGVAGEDASAAHGADDRKPARGARRLSAILLMSCPDRPGLVAEITAFIAHVGGNILDLQQHVDTTEKVFFMRVEWDLAASTLGRGALAEAFRPLAERRGMAWTLRFSDERLRLALFVSREGHCLYDLLARWQAGELPAEVAVIVSNHEALAAAAASFGIPFVLVPVSAENKSAAEAEQRRLLTDYAVDLVVLARYMQVLSPTFVEAYPQKIINIHHSFLPAFAGARPYHQAFERGVKIIGATSHYVTADLDAGPIIEQDVARADHRDSVADLVRKGRDLEKLVLARAVRAHLLHRILVYGNKTVVFA